MQEKVGRLARFIQENPAFANVPFLVVAGRSVTPAEALALLQAGRYVEEVLVGLAKLGLDLPWELAEEFYRRLALARPEVRLYGLGFVPPLSPTECLEHVRARDEVGRELVEAYARMLSFMREVLNA